MKFRGDWAKREDLRKKIKEMLKKSLRLKIEDLRILKIFSIGGMVVHI